MENEIEQQKRDLLNRYWRKNIILMSGCLIVWALVSYGCGILWVEPLNEWTLPGTHYPLGFWFAQQGAIVTFVLLVLLYATVMNRVDAHHLQELQELEAAQAEASS